jgi:hypothetical protein
MKPNPKHTAIEFWLLTVLVGGAFLAGAVEALRYALS